MNANSEPRQDPLCFSDAAAPCYTYVLRHWFTDPADGHSTQAKVLIVTSHKPLSRYELRAKVEDLEVGKVSDFLLVDMNPGCSAVLDTWEPVIEGVMLPDGSDGPCQLFANWWVAELCEVVDDFELPVG